MIQWINKKRNKKGFTLIELVVVIAILGILAAIAVPRLSGARDNAQESANLATARTIMSAVTMAEATHGDDFEIADVNGFLDSPKVSAYKGDTDSGWTVTITNPIKVYFDGDEVTLPAVE